MGAGAFCLGSEGCSRLVPTLLRKGGLCGEQGLDQALALKEGDLQLWWEAAGRQTASWCLASC